MLICVFANHESLCFDKQTIPDYFCSETKWYQEYIFETLNDSSNLKSSNHSSVTW